MSWGDILKTAGSAIINAGTERVVTELTKEEIESLDPGASGGMTSGSGGGLFGSWQWAPWVQYNDTTGGDSLRAAIEYNKTMVDRGLKGLVNAVAKLTVPRTDSEGNKAYWAQRIGDDWTIPVQRLGQDVLAQDQNISPSGIEFDSITTAEGTGTSGVPGPVGAPGPPGTSGGMFGFQFGRVRPRIINQRRCPAGMRLAKDGWCYPTKLLPAAARENQVKKAPVTWSDAEAMRKARATEKRLQSFTKRGEASARKTFGLVKRKR